MSYKTDQDKAYSILYCLTPQRILINSPLGVNGKIFANRFKKEGFSVLSVGVFDLMSASAILKNKIKKLWNGKSQNPVLIEGKFSSTEDIAELFTGVYSYVYLYPNSLKGYARMIHDSIVGDNKGAIPNTDKERLEKIRNIPEEFNKELGLLTKKYSEINRSLYREHCEIFDNKILTVLL
jgi:hypothetical protein